MPSRITAFLVVLLASALVGPASNAASVYTVTAHSSSIALNNFQITGSFYEGAISDGVSSSSVSADAMSPARLGFTLSQTLAPPDMSTDGTSSIDFVLAAAQFFSIADGAADVSGAPGYTADYDLFLLDLTTGVTLYDSKAGGLIAGLLLPTDSYRLSASASLANASASTTLLYTPSLTFASSNTAVTPEPSNLALLATGIVGAVAATRRRVHA